MRFSMVYTRWFILKNLMKTCKFQREYESSKLQKCQLSIIKKQRNKGVYFTASKFFSSNVSYITAITKRLDNKCRRRKSFLIRRWSKCYPRSPLHSSLCPNKLATFVLSDDLFLLQRHDEYTISCDVLLWYFCCQVLPNLSQMLTSIAERIQHLGYPSHLSTTLRPFNRKISVVSILNWRQIDFFVYTSIREFFLE